MLGIGGVAGTRISGQSFSCLFGVFATMSALSFMRWAQNYHLFILGRHSPQLVSADPLPGGTGTSGKNLFLLERASAKLRSGFCWGAIGVPLVLHALFEALLRSDSAREWRRVIRELSRLTVPTGCVEVA
jgi:hypothetical protein